MRKIYVRQWTEKTVDEEELQVVECCQSEIHPLSFIIFLEK
jgi:hypothetical protein